MTLTIRNVSFERNDQLLLNNISCEIDSGELLQIQGANGSGKSTLLRILAGYIEPQKGQVLWENQCIHHQHEDYQQQLHYLGHLNGIKPYLTVQENLKLFCTLSHRQNNNIKTIIKRMGLNHLINKQANTLSSGQLRRLALTRLLLHSVNIWIVDEPTTALDKNGQGLFSDLLQEHLTQGGIAILTSHHDFELLNNAKTIQLMGGSDTQ